jgi:DNA polymerase-1
MKKLMLIDGMAMVYRAYYALNRNPRMNSHGMNTSAVLGFTMTLYDLLKQQKPTHCAVAFDLSEPTFRHQQYEEYKANRDKMPEDIQQAMPYIHSVISGFTIPMVTKQGYEADDIIGTMARLAEEAGFDEILMVTPDKDFAQLVTDRTHLYRFGRMGKPDTVYYPDDVRRSFDVESPLQVADILGLWGDAIDNIPGIPGVGEKKAKQLVAQFGSVENLIANSDEVRNEKLRNLVKQYAGQALLSKKLATICREVPLEWDETSLMVGTPDYENLAALFAELEFKAFAKKMYTDLSVSDPDLAMKLNLRVKGGKGGSESAERKTEIGERRAGSGSKKPTDPLQVSLFETNDTPTDEPHTQATLRMATISMLSELQNKDFAIFLDQDPKTGTIRGISFATSGDESAYLSFSGGDNYSFLQSALENRNTLKVCYGVKNLKHILKDHGIRLSGEIFDVELAHYLIDPEARHYLDFIASSMSSTVLDESSADYPCQAATTLWSLYEPMKSRLIENDMYALYKEVELPLTDVLVDMEDEGVRIDVDALKQYSNDLSHQLAEIEKEIYNLAGCEFNIASPKQLGEILYDTLKITDKPPRTATKQYSTAEEVLKKLEDRHPIVPLILEYRSINKLVSTYLDVFPKLINSQTGRLHTIYNQTVTATGRLSSSNPNLQNIPIRTDRGREIRKAFVAKNDDYTILAADYSQIELRIIASLSHDQHMIESFSKHQDIHAATAAKIYHIDLDSVSKEQRRNAKSVNFGIVYGISPFGLAEQLDIPRKEAAALIEEYFAQYPSIKQYIDSNIEFAREHGYAQTLLGRRRYLYDINSRNTGLRQFAERNAVNMPIQGTSADMIKIAMIRIHRQLNELNMKTKMILQVHDELVFDVYKPELEQVKEIVKYEMEHALPLSIPVEVGIDVGNNWLEAH